MVDGRDIALVALGAAVATALAKLTTTGASSRAVPAPGPNLACGGAPTGWLLIVKLTFSDEESASTFLRDFKPCADGVTKLEVCILRCMSTLSVLHTSNSYYLTPLSN